MNLLFCNKAHLTKAYTSPICFIKSKSHSFIHLFIYFFAKHICLAKDLEISDYLKILLQSNISLLRLCDYLHKLTESGKDYLPGQFLKPKGPNRVFHSVCDLSILLSVTMHAHWNESNLLYCCLLFRFFKTELLCVTQAVLELAL